MKKILFFFICGIGITRQGPAQNKKENAPKFETQKVYFKSVAHAGWDSIEVVQYDTLLIWQGDIVIDPSRVVKERPPVTAAPNTYSVGVLQSRSIFGRLWEEGRIPFTFKNVSRDLRSTCMQAIRILNTNTSLTLVEKDEHDEDFVEFNEDALFGVASSKVGRQEGKQSINLANNTSVGTVMHEILHAAGFLHEHSRTDRDEFIEIDYLNIWLIYHTQYFKYTDPFYAELAGKTGIAFQDIGRYDYCSIMHYPRKSLAFAIDTSKPVIKILKDLPAECTDIGQGVLSKGDIAGIFRLYPFPKVNGKFGFAMCKGDFNNDGIPEVAIGDPYANNQRGLVSIFGFNTAMRTFGRLDGLNQRGLGSNEEKDRFGYSLASADFDQDGYDDLAVGVPGERFGNNPKSGAVMFFKGGQNGLTAWLRQDHSTLEVTTSYSNLGFSMCTGDFDKDGYPDLAVGSPGDYAPYGHFYERSAISPSNPNQVALGRYSRPSNAEEQLLSTKDEFVAILKYRRSAGDMVPVQIIRQQGEDNENFDGFGYSLAAGDFDGDGKDELAISSPAESSGSRGFRYGDVKVYKHVQETTELFQTSMVFTGLKHWTTINGNTCANAKHLGLFGLTLLTKDFDGDNIYDLAIGAPRHGGSGNVSFLKGTKAGFSLINCVDQTRFSANEDDDLFGSSIAFLDYLKTESMFDRFDINNKDKGGQTSKGVMALVGIPGENNNTGWVCSFRINDNAFVESSWSLSQGESRLGRGEAKDRFGSVIFPVLIHDDWYVFVSSLGEIPNGSSGNRKGSVFVFKFNHLNNTFRPLQVLQGN